MLSISTLTQHKVRGSAGLLLAMALVLLAGSGLGGCSLLPTLKTPSGQTAVSAVLNGIASTIVGIIEAKNQSTAADINGVATALLAVDYSEPVSVSTVGAALTAHASNMTTAQKARISTIVADLNAALQVAIALNPSLAVVQTDTRTFLQALVTASSPNPLTPVQTTMLKLKPYVSPVCYRHQEGGCPMQDFDWGLYMEPVSAD